MNAAQWEEPGAYLRKLVPYAGALTGSVIGFEGGDPPKHVGFDLDEMMEAVKAVGYSGTVAVEYVGEGDAEEGVVAGREAIESALLAEESS